MLLFDIKPISDEEAEPDLPRYSDKGRILFRFWPIANEEPDIEVLGYDGSAMWMHGESWKDYFGEYDEEWHFDHIRRASPEEERLGVLSDDDTALSNEA
jgi:hypothetical protein